MGQGLQRLQRWLVRLEDGLLVLLLSGMVLLAFAQIVARNLWHAGFDWADPGLRVAVLWVAMFGAMVATRQDRHIRIDLVSRFLSAASKRVSELLANLFSAVICGLLAWHAGRFVLLEWQEGVTAFHGVPTWLLESILPLGFTVMAARFLLHAVDRLRGDA